nr:replication protein A 70 kDa DNA-binding subunit B-like [Ipomoea trifida]
MYCGGCKGSWHEGVVRYKGNKSISPEFGCLRGMSMLFRILMKKDQVESYYSVFSLEFAETLFWSSFSKLATLCIEANPPILFTPAVAAESCRALSTGGMSSKPFWMLESRQRDCGTVASADVSEGLSAKDGMLNVASSSSDGSEPLADCALALDFFCTAGKVDVPTGPPASPLGKSFPDPTW